MEFKTYVNSTKEYNMNKIYTELLERVKNASVLDSKISIDTDLLIKILQKSKGNHFSSRYGLKNEILFADSELINAYEREEHCLEYLQYRYDFKYYPIHHKRRDFPLVMAVEASSRCNLRCHMCFQNHMDDQSVPQNKGILSYELYQKFLDELKKHKLYSIVFASRGEPLLNPYIDKMIQEAKKQGVLDIKLNTNAALLTEELSRKLLVSGLDLIVFSVDSINPENYYSIRGIQLNTVLDNIEKFLSIKRVEYPNSKIKVRVAMVITKEMKHIAEYEVEAAKDYWLKRVDELSVKSEANFIHIYDNQQNQMESNTCNLLWERMYLWHDGRVNPCDIDHLSTLCVGDISQGETISSIWNGTKMELLRLEHLENRSKLKSVCLNCEGY